MLMDDFGCICENNDYKSLNVAMSRSVKISHFHLSEIMRRYTDYNNTYKIEKNIPELLQRLIDSNLFFDSVKSVVDDGEEEMYDIEVDEHHEFTCNGFVVHNCQGSTYDNAIVFYSDICANWNEQERKRILYTSVTRPRNKLYIF